MLYSMLDFTYFFSLRLHLVVSEKPVSTIEIVLSVTENTYEQNRKLIMLAVTATATVTVIQSTHPDQKDCYSNQGQTHLRQDRVRANTNTHTGVSQNVPGCSA
jgi:hypothetical protein